MHMPLVFKDSRLLKVEGGHSNVLFIRIIGVFCVSSLRMSYVVTLFKLIILNHTLVAEANLLLVSVTWLLT